MTQTQKKPHRVHNFCAGPAAIPTAVLAKAQAEMLDWEGKGVSVMEISHRSPDYIEIAQNAEANLRKLMDIPDNYRVLFLQGGASLQFSAIPLNLLNRQDTRTKSGTQHLNPVADYLVTGAWSKKALKEAHRYGKLGLGDINEVDASVEGKYTGVSERATWNVSADAVYFHYCANETIHGIQIFDPPNVDAPIIADMSSCILSHPIDVSKFGMIYAGAQKNIGPAGLVIVIIREDLLGGASEWCPTLLNYEHLNQKQSMSNTPATYSWYLAGLVFEWLLEQGGVDAIAKINQQKAKLLYDAIDNSPLYHNGIDPKYRSIMNVPFTLNLEALSVTSDMNQSELDQLFLEQAAKVGLVNLKGHRDVGGIRASIYNAVSLQSVRALVDFMQSFEQKYAQSHTK